MGWLRELYIKTKKIAAMYTGIFVVVMFLNQLLFFGLCLNPICIVAAMPHVLFITVVIGMWDHNRKILKTLKFVRKSYDEVKKHIEQNRESNSEQASGDLFTGNIHLFVTQYQGDGEADFETVLGRYKKPKIVSKIRMNNRDKSKALLEAIKRSKHDFNAGDIVAIVRGGGDTNAPQFDPYRDSETCDEVRYLYDRAGVVTVSGVGHSPDRLPIDEAVNFAQITPTDAAMQVAFLVDGQKWPV